MARESKVRVGQVDLTSILTKEQRAEFEKHAHQGAIFYLRPDLSAITDADAVKLLSGIGAFNLECKTNKAVGLLQKALNDVYSNAAARMFGKLNTVRDGLKSYFTTRKIDMSGLTRAQALTLHAACVWLEGAEVTTSGHTVSQLIGTANSMRKAGGKPAITWPSDGQAGPLSAFTFNADTLFPAAKALGIKWSPVVKNMSNTVRMPAQTGLEAKASQPDTLTRTPSGEHKAGEQKARQATRLIKKVAVGK